VRFLEAASFTEQAPGRLLKLPRQTVGASEDVWAFVPDPLPPKIQLDWPTITELARANQALGQLAGVEQMLPNPHLLIRPFLHREAVLSSRIEGTVTSVQQLLLFEAAKSKGAELGDVREVVNYIRAVDYGMERVKELPVSLRLIRELHERLMTGVRGHEERPGEFRTIQNWIGLGQSPIELARYVPPPVPEMHQALAAFEQSIGEPKALPPLVHLALVHYQFEAIHPFRDGNGRIGRLLTTLLLCAANYYQQEPLLPRPLLYLSAYFERQRQAYYDHLLAVSQRGEWAAWLTFFLKGVTEQSIDAVQRAQRLLDLRQSYRERLQTARTSALLLLLVDELFASPYITAAEAQRLLKVTAIPVYGALRKLEEVGILREVTGQSRNRMWAAEEILDNLREEP
jgi:Fic family protein